MRRFVAKSADGPTLYLSLIPFRNLRQPCLKAVLIFDGKTRAVSLTGPSAKMWQFFCIPFYRGVKNTFLERVLFRETSVSFLRGRGTVDWYLKLRDKNKRSGFFAPKRKAKSSLFVFAKKSKVCVIT